MTYRVHFHLYAAGGRLWPTWRVVEAETPEAAIAKAEQQERSADAREGRCYGGYFNNATAVPKETP